MFAQAARLAALFVSVAILLVGHGLQLSLLPLRAHALGWSDPQIGLAGSVYFAGFLVGCFSVPALVRRVGHVRVFTVLTAIMTAALLGIALTDALPAWLALRLMTGWAIAGMYLVMESWLNEAVGNTQRGAMLALYTMTVLLGMAVGQLLLNVATPDGHQIVLVAALCVVVAAVPVGLARIDQPHPVPTAVFSPLLVLRGSQAAAASSFVGGIVTGCFFGLGPVFGRKLGLDITAVSLMMSAGILGGALAQWPIGRLSDAVDRRQVIGAVMLAAVAICALATIVAPLYLPYVMFLFGCFTMPIYALSLAHAGDNVSGSFLEVGTGILMVNAVGAVLGPLVVAMLMSAFGARSFFVFCGVVLALGAAAMLIFVRRAPERRPHFSPFEVATTASAQGAIELDPRSDADAPESSALEDGEDEPAGQRPPPAGAEDDPDTAP